MVYFENKLDRYKWKGPIISCKRHSGMSCYKLHNGNHLEPHHSKASSSTKTKRVPLVSCRSTDINAFWAASLSNPSSSPKTNIHNLRKCLKCIWKLLEMFDQIHLKSSWPKTNLQEVVGLKHLQFLANVAEYPCIRVAALELLVLESANHPIIYCFNIFWKWEKLDWRGLPSWHTSPEESAISRHTCLTSTT